MGNGNVISVKMGGQLSQQLGNLKSAISQQKAEVKALDKEMAQLARKGQSVGQDLLDKRKEAADKLSAYQQLSSVAKENAKRSSKDSSEAAGGPSFREVRRFGNLAKNIVKGNFTDAAHEGIMELRHSNLLPAGGGSLAVGAAVAVALAAVSYAGSEIQHANDGRAKIQPAREMLQQMNDAAGIDKRITQRDVDAFFNKTGGRRVFGDDNPNGWGRAASDLGANAGNAAIAVRNWVGNIFGLKDAEKFKTLDERNADKVEKLKATKEKVEEAILASRKFSDVYDVRDANAQLNSIPQQLKDSPWVRPETRIIEREQARLASRAYARTCLSRCSNRTGD